MQQLFEPQKKEVLFVYSKRKGNCKNTKYTPHIYNGFVFYHKEPIIFMVQKVWGLVPAL